MKNIYKIMKQNLLLIIVLSIMYCKEPKKHGQYKVSDIISLILKSNNEEYEIIDPDDYIKKEHENQLEKQLKNVYKNHKIKSFIIVIRSAFLKDENNKEIDLILLKIY